MYFLKQYHIIISLLLIVSCSKAKPLQKNNFEIDLKSYATLNNIQGGITFLTISSDNTIFYNDIDITDYTAEVPMGDIEIYMVAFTGPSPWQGSTYCGTVSVNISEELQDIDINLTASECSSNPQYQQVIDNKIPSTGSSFDTATFGTSVFSP